VDKATGEVVTLFAHTTGIQGIRIKGPSGPIFISGSGPAGDVTVSRFDTSIASGKNTRIAFLGTSITEGALATDEDDRSWADIIDDARNSGDVVNLSTQGVTAAQIAAMLPGVLSPFTNLQYVVIDLGANDGTQSAWRTAMATIIAAVVAAGAQPVLCTVMPRSGYPTGAMTTDIRGFFFGSYPYIDLSAAVSTDGVNWISGYQLADGIHPTTAGSAAMAARALNDAPYLLDGSYAAQLVD